ncbi:MAG: segregation/condensation protein A [Bacteriovoracaceae bacterium]|nr:segregation/condensation protein A [Bacteriovoracaceae bacterium]
MLESSIHVRTDHFDGPLALLLLLIQKQEMDIRDLDITVITKQYIDFLQEMQELNFDLAGDYLLMAASLVLLKSHYSIESGEEQELLGELGLGQGDLQITSREDLIRRLLELQKFQKMGELLWSLPKRGEDIFCHPAINKKIIRDAVLTPLELSTLTSAYMDILRRESRKFVVMQKETMSISKKLEVIKRFMPQGKRTDFFTLLGLEGEGIGVRKEKILTFISLLELARLKKISLFQNEDFGNIYIDVLDDLSEFNTSLADGFENEVSPMPAVQQ